MKDALGNDLIIGQTYGYSRSENGLTTVKVGKLIRITEKQVTLEVELSKQAYWSNDVEDKPKHNKSVSVKANGLFPVYTELLKKIKELSDISVINDAQELQDNLEEIDSLLEVVAPHIKNAE